MKNLKIVGITETTILNEEGKVVFDAGALEHTALEDHEQAKKITKLFAAAPDLLLYAKLEFDFATQGKFEYNGHVYSHAVGRAKLTAIRIEAIAKATE